MPELPEVETIRRGLAPALQGRRILAVTVGNKRLRQQSSPEEFRQWVAGRRLKFLRRRGKYLLFGLEGGAILLIHLGMTGRLMLLPFPAPPLPHVHLAFQMEGGRDLIFQDTRRFGQALVFPPGVTPPPLVQMGREPFSKKVTSQWLVEQAQGRTRPIKNFLLDGRTLAGLGNIYACEILFAAGIHPAVAISRLTLEEWSRVLKNTRRILRAAIRKGGTTINDYLNSQGETGLFQLELQVYGRGGEPCPRCGNPIARLVQAGRSSFFCPECQK
jgi:formamidopyrimidine-DNA glycosylase